MSSSNHIDLNGLSITNSGGATNNNHSNRVRASTAPSTPSLTSFTPPPPGFDAPAATTTTNNSNSAAQTTAIEQSPHRKSPSFTNLAMALGTGLAECMDNSTSDNTTTANVSSMAVDNYARQSRHAVTRLIGHSQFQQQQREGRGSVPPSLTMGGQQSQTQSQLSGGGGVYGVGNVGGVNNNGVNNGGGVNNTNGGGQVRFTAAMMAQHHQTNHHPNNANVVSGDQLVLSGQFNRNNGDSSTAATPSGAASNHHGTNNGGMGYNPLTVIGHFAGVDGIAISITLQQRYNNQLVEESGGSAGIEGWLAVSDK